MLHADRVLLTDQCKPIETKLQISQSRQLMHQTSTIPRARLPRTEQSQTQRTDALLLVVVSPLGRVPPDHAPSPLGLPIHRTLTPARRAELTSAMLGTHTLSLLL